MTTDKDWIQYEQVRVEGGYMGIIVSDKQEEERIVDPKTGGMKGQKNARYDLIPPDLLDKLAHVYGMGAKKYEDWNWAKGYRWSLSYGALLRHLQAFWSGEELDPESNLPHLAHVVWHCFTLHEFSRHHKDKDDRVAVTGPLAPTIGDKNAQAK